MSDSAEDIRNQMQRLRQSATGEVREIVDSAKTLTDWRYHVKHHPWLCMGAAMALGFLLVPRNRRVQDVDAKELAELLKKYNVAVNAPQQSSKGMLKSMIGAAIPIIARQAVSVAQQRFAEQGGIGSLFGGPSGRTPAEPEHPEYGEFHHPR